LRRRFRFGEDVELLDGGTAGVELLRYLDGRERVIVIDAIAAGHPPGTVFRVEGEDVPRTFHQRISPHQIGLSDVLATALITDALPASIVMFGVEPKDLTTGLELTPVVDASLDRLTDAVVEELRRLGCRAEERQGPPPRQREWSPR
jgi:hydrogenase maturation protease